MTSIHVVGMNDRRKYASEIKDFHRKRHDIFVEERGWEALRKADCYEIDEFDDEHAVYLLAIDNGKLVGGQRLYPTTRPHMITEVFPHLVQRELPQGDDVLEWTRYFVVPERRFGRTDGRLLAAVQDYCLDQAVTTITAVVETWWLPRWHEVGFKTRPLGLPQIVGGQPTVAVAIDVSEESAAAVKRRCGLVRSAASFKGIANVA